MRLQYISAVQVRHLAVRLNPDLVARVRRDYGQRSDVEAELAGLREFSEADTQREEVIAGYGGGEVGE